MTPWNEASAYLHAIYAWNDIWWWGHVHPLFHLWNFSLAGGSSTLEFITWN